MCGSLVWSWPGAGVAGAGARRVRFPLGNSLQIWDAAHPHQGDGKIRSPYRAFEAAESDKSLAYHLSTHSSQGVKAFSAAAIPWTHPLDIPSGKGSDRCSRGLVQGFRQGFWMGQRRSGRRVRAVVADTLARRACRAPSPFWVVNLGRLGVGAPPERSRWKLYVLFSRKSTIIAHIPQPGAGGTCAGAPEIGGNWGGDRGNF